MSTKTFIIILCIITFWVAIVDTGQGIAHFAHIGGIVYGFIYMLITTKKYNFFTKNRYKEREYLKRQFKVIRSSDIEERLKSIFDESDKDPNRWN